MQALYVIMVFFKLRVQKITPPGRRRKARFAFARRLMEEEFSLEILFAPVLLFWVAREKF